jgi:Protein of unknown function (DUF1579)
MKRTLVALAACLALFFASASVSLAQAAKKPAKKAAPAAGTAAMSMKPSPEMDKIKWMTGTWQCNGKTMASPMGPEHPTEGVVTVEMTLDGFWMLSHYREKKTAQNPMPISGDEYWTYDSAEKMWDRVSVDSMGGFSTATSKGWENGKLVWTGEGMMGGQKTKARDTFVQKSPREVNYSGEIGTPGGKWAPAWEAVCKK